MAKTISNKKSVVIVGGANGVGKTTFAYQYKNEYEIDYLCTDDIVKELSLLSKGNVELRAGKEFFGRLENYYRLNKSVIIESTLSGLGLAKKIKQFKSNGYLVHIIYIFLDNVALCKNRVSLRVQKGGHNIPTVEIERRYQRSLTNFQKIYVPLADTWQLFYNGFERPLEVAVGEHRQTMILDDEFYRIFKEISK
jgi:predicted ABC-type ATPase